MDFAPMSDPEHENQRCGVVNPRDRPGVADSVSPKFAEAVALRRLVDRTGVISGATRSRGKRRMRAADFLARRNPVENRPPLTPALSPASGRKRGEGDRVALGGAFELSSPRHGAG